ncbi:hypothetical protein MYSTI_06605 [Myxococcus stipitatus DSM 14675]|uniref:Uncharacterized protein n=1 Tax=Myxococcus stipitatus (strain DSM 14675 / JCM 12634 / Mx s8) TaxID=1278073 RepID=L7UIN9_MYXSD|nr:PAAR-like domain-containing protein [Myxococcus stipitatus]AGC47878.1 hypothetical protein MYSTI_06605 [Myxococcus stipitatus DSM 14675]
MGTVSINSPRTPVTTGSNGIATAAVPNVCKMPGPPAPFVPTPLPNIGRSNLSPKKFSTSVIIEGKPVAIQGATFGSTGDIASKATGGGLVSANTHGPTAFVAPGSMNVKIEGKSVHLLGDATTNNNGSPPNASTPAELQESETPPNRKKIDCEKGPPSGPLSKCEKEELCAKCAHLNQKAEAGELKKPDRDTYKKNRDLGDAAAKSLAGKAQRNPDLGKGMLEFHAMSEDCKQEHVKNGFKGTSADHVHDIGLDGHPTVSSNLKWMGSRVNSWMGSIMGQYNPEVHKGVAPNCCG